MALATSLIVAALSWTVVAKPAARAPSNGAVWVAEVGQGRNVVALFGGWTGTDAAVKAWAAALQAAHAFDGLDVGRLYAVPGPKDSAYSSAREVPTGALAAALAGRAAAQRPGLVLVAAHSSGAYVADDFLAQLKAKDAALIGRVAYFKLDGGWLPRQFTPAFAAALGGLYCVAARCGAVKSRNFGAMTSACPKTFAPAKPQVVVVAAAAARCTSPNCCHDALVTSQPHKPGAFDVVRDYSDYGGERRVMTDWLVRARPALERLAAP